MIKAALGRLISGHGVASGQSTKDTRFPQGTIRLQELAFRQRGFDLASYFKNSFVHGTLNIRFARGVTAIRRPDLVFRDVSWTEFFPPENFFLSQCVVRFASREFRGLIYIPDPATKPDHFQDARTVEVIAEPIPGLKCGDTLEVIFDSDAISIE
jgi:hypothetical protein